LITRTNALLRSATSFAGGAVEVPLLLVLVTGCVCFGSLEHAEATNSIVIIKPNLNLATIYTHLQRSMDTSLVPGQLQDKDLATNFHE
jgi:hypothetical protein